MSEENNPQNDSQDIDLQEEAGATFHRGSALSLFTSDRAEDLLALLFALLVALFVYVNY
jgi:preprotein translocase subunit SecG